MQFKSRADDTEIVWRLQPAMENCNLNHNMTIQSTMSIIDFSNWAESIVRGIWLSGGVDVSIGSNNTYHLTIMMAGKRDICELDPFGSCNPLSTKDCVVPNYEILQMYTALGLMSGGGGGCGGGGDSALDPVTPC